MANRHYSYQELEEKLIQSTVSNHIFKPGGTLGRHHLEITPGPLPNTIHARGVELNLRYDAAQAKYVSNYNVTQYHPISEWVVVKKEGTLGYNCGDVWAIKPVREMRPLQAFRHTYKLSRENVILWEEGGTIEIEELRSAVRDDNPYANRNRFWGSGETVMYNGENCMITEYHSFRGGVDQRREVHKIYLRKNRLRAAIKEASGAIDNRQPKTNIKHPANNLLFAP